MSRCAAVTNSELLFFSGQTLFNRPAVTWLLQDAQPSFAGVDADGHSTMTNIVIDQLRRELCASGNPHQQRKAALQTLFADVPPDGRLRYSQHVVSRGQDVYELLGN